MKVLILFSVVCLFLNVAKGQGTDDGAQYQPEFDSIDVDSYLSNEKLFSLQMSCILFDGPCDNVGRWLKPRITAGLLGECLKCTPKQREGMAKLLTFITATKPDLYKVAVTKYLQKSGIDVPSEESGKVGMLEQKVNSDNSNAIKAQ